MSVGIAQPGSEQTASPADVPTFASILKDLRLPLSLDEADAVLLILDGMLASEAEPQPDEECAIELIRVLVVKMRFYVLVLFAQNYLIRDIRKQLREQPGIG